MSRLYILPCTHTIFFLNAIIAYYQTQTGREERTKNQQEALEEKEDVTVYAIKL